MTKPIYFHLLMQKKRPGIPDNSEDTGRCPKCAGETEEGYGHAGGGLGIYTFCEPCGLIVTKTEETEP